MAHGAALFVIASWVGGREVRLAHEVEPTGVVEVVTAREIEVVMDDAVARFRVHGDGTVDIDDKNDIDLKWRVPIPTPSRIVTLAAQLIAQPRRADARGVPTEALGKTASLWLSDEFTLRESKRIHAILRQLREINRPT